MFSLGGDFLVEVQFYPARTYTALPLLGQVTAMAVPQEASISWGTRQHLLQKHVLPSRQQNTALFVRPSLCLGKFFPWSKSRSKLALPFRVKRMVTLQLFPLKRLYSYSTTTSLKTCSFCNSLVSEELFHWPIEKSWLICFSLFHRLLLLR